MENESLEDQIEKLFQESGGCGWFQVLAYFAITLGISGPNFFLFEIGFYTQAPDTYICTYTDGVQPSVDICTKEYICKNDPRIATWEADPDSDKTLYNWQQKLDLTCKDEWVIAMIGASYFIGWCFTLLWLPTFADKRGRKKFYWFG